MSKIVTDRFRSKRKGQNTNSKSQWDHVCQEHTWQQHEWECFQGEHKNTSYHAMHQRNESAAADGDGASIRTVAPASSIQSTPAKNKKLVKDLKTHHCGMDFDSAFINAVFVKCEECCSLFFSARFVGCALRKLMYRFLRQEKTEKLSSTPLRRVR